MASTNQSLFPLDLPESQWKQFQAAGFCQQACGVIYRLSSTVTNGMPLGGIDTGCLDMETTGLLGYCTIFNTHVPRRGPINLPLLGLSIANRTWVLCHPRPKDGEGGSQHSASRRPYNLWRGKGLVKQEDPITPVPTELKLDGVETAKEIHYWGHYPVVDLEFETNAPISVGLRAWSPLLPGDVVLSMLPGIVFEVHLRNISESSQKGMIAISFPGPTEQEADTQSLTRSQVHDEFNGIEVTGEKASYVLGVIGSGKPRIQRQYPLLNLTKSLSVPWKDCTED